MNKEIEEAIEQLQHTISIFEDIEDEGNLEIDFIDVTAMKILIEYVKDSTPNSAIREKIEELKEEQKIYKLETERVTSILGIINFKIKLLEEILKEGEK